MRYIPLVPFIIGLLLAAPFARAQTPLLPEIQALWAPHEAAQKAVAAERDKKLANLDYIYLLNVEKLKNDRAAAGDLDGALAAKAELDRLSAHQALSDEQRKAMNLALQALRASYDAALKGYDDEAAKQNAALLQKLLADLEALEKRITTTGDLDKALRVKAEKERIAAEGTKAQPAPITPEVKVAPVQGAGAEPPMMKFGNVQIAGATKERPFENSLGMKFVPVPGTEVLFCIWETRVKDYAVYAAANQVNDEWTRQQKDGVPVGRAPNHPVCGVNWNDAKAFCKWLTEKETAEGKLAKGTKYRLPTDVEWSRAAGLANEEGKNAKQRNNKAGGFPWGEEWPPRNNSGNYADSAWHDKFPKEKWLKGYTDGFATTAPVGSFSPNRFGIYDLGGNVAEWCEDNWEPGYGIHRVLRGAAYGAHIREPLLSSNRNPTDPKLRQTHMGFRCVVGESAR